VRDPAQAVHAHVADALTGLLVPELAAATRIADIGAGAGIPGLVLAAALPGAEVIEVESLARKCAFLERAVAAMGLGNAAVVCARAEEWAAGREACDAVTARAVAPLPVLVEYAAPLLRPGGALVAWKGTPDADEVADGDHAAAVLGLAAGRRVAVPPFPGADQRSLYVYLKVRSLPNGYPRRPGMARKRPLRAST
jgi:16S rRNA (guanine527-N7)-methyltransferase